ncbi:MAG: hypothetical protein WD097_06540 [Balneolales bacterium]
MGVILLAGLLLSRVFQPEGSRRPDIYTTVYEAEEYAGRSAVMYGEAISDDLVSRIDGRPPISEF